MQAHLLRAAEVKKAIEWIMSNLDGHYAADSVAAAIAHGALNSENAPLGDSQSGSFPRNSIKVSPIQPKSNDATSPSNLSKKIR